MEQLVVASTVARLEDESELLHCGLDSLGTMELRLGLSRRFKVALSLVEQPTLATLVHCIDMPAWFLTTVLPPPLQLRIQLDQCSSRFLSGASARPGTTALLRRLLMLPRRSSAVWLPFCLVQQQCCSRQQRRL